MLSLMSCLHHWPHQTDCPSTYNINGYLK
uniref:Uncharacterized protein n=1 Tax=Arundo donax TaxID=35708 RepID=A0A0A9AMP2_ARUDO